MNAIRPGGSKKKERGSRKRERFTPRKNEEESRAFDRMERTWQERHGKKKKKK